MRGFTIALLLIACSHANAASWQIVNLTNGGLYASFDHDGGSAYSNVLTHFSSSIQAYTPSPFPALTDTHLSATFDGNPIYQHLEILFAAALTPTTAAVDISYIGLAWDGNWCTQNPICIEPDPDNFSAINLTLAIPLPGTAWLLLVAIASMGWLRFRAIN